MKTIMLLIAFSCTINALAQQNPRSTNELEFKRTHSTVAPSAELHPVVLPDGRLILSVADTVYMLDANGQQLWKYSTESASETLTSDPAFNAERNEVAIVGFDLLFVRLDATTGKVIWRADTVGRATFASVMAYEKGFLVVVDMSGYRRNGSSPIPDTLDYWGESEKDFWSIDFPPHAELVVSGKRIYALRRNKEKLRLQELQPPKATNLHPAG
jgi:hypothetical protein